MYGNSKKEKKIGQGDVRRGLSKQTGFGWNVLELLCGRLSGQFLKLTLTSLTFPLLFFPHHVTARAFWRRSSHAESGAALPLRASRRPTNARACCECLKSDSPLWCAASRDVKSRNWLRSGVCVKCLSGWAHSPLCATELSRLTALRAERELSELSSPSI